jgi:arsenite methyltransferase
MAKAAVAEQKPPGKPDYGLDAPVLVKRMFSRGAWTLAFALVLYYINHNIYPGPATRLLLVVGGIGAILLAVGATMVWSSRVAKLQLRDRLLDAVAIGPDDKVLDVGCGRGLMAIGAAKRLKSGKATGVDVWNELALSGNSADAAKQNAKIEGVADRVRIETSDPRKLPYPENHYDVVLSSLAVHNISDREGRDQSLREMWRVLKPGGRLLIFDILHTGAYAKTLREAGARDVELSAMGFLWCLPTRSLIARK